MNRLKMRSDAIVKEFSQFSDWEGRYKHLIEIGKRMPAFPEALRREELKVKGCQSQVWLHAERGPQGEVRLQADSDALIVKGLVALLVRYYDEASVDEILQDQPQFIAEIGLSQNLTPSRASGLVAMIRQIKYYAQAFKLLEATKS